jgi:FAD-dependent oxidoreductase family protein
MKAKIVRVLLVLLIFLSFSCSSSNNAETTIASSNSDGFDVVVYGGTASGAIAAISAAKEGLRVALLEPENHIGGMVSGGLGATDVAIPSLVGGLCLEFFGRVGNYYGLAGPAWNFEPHVAEMVFRGGLNEAGVKVFFNHRLSTVQREGRRIVSIQMENGAVFKGKVFIDATYEGDMLPRAGISYTWGREGQATYGESLAGRGEYAPLTWFGVYVDGYDESGSLLPLIYAGDPGNPGEGDKKIQAYNFRLCLTDITENQVPFVKPANYDPKRYEIFRRYLSAASKGGTNPLKFSYLLGSAPMPNGKTDTNNSGSMSTDFIGGSWDYPEADYQRRKEIWDEHKYYTQGLLYFLANDPGVPADLRSDAGRWGLAKDEFVDTENWPHQLYVREARRMLGEYVMTQSDLQTARFKEDSIGLGSYNIDSHAMQRIFVPGKGMVTEGFVNVPVSPYDIPYRAILPKAAECENLLVPVCLSASHVAYSSLRMEPQYMIMGHAAGQAAFLAIRDNVSVQGIGVQELQDRLRSQGQILTLGDYSPPTGSIVINGGAGTTYSATANITLAADDNLGVTFMQFSKDGGKSWSPWETSVSSKAMTLVKGPGENTVHVRFMDTVGNISAAYSATITLLSPSFNCSILINDGAATTYSTTVNLTLTAENAVGVTSMQFSKDGASWYPWEPFSPTRTATLASGPGTNSIYVRFKDGAGNISPVYSTTITLLPYPTFNGSILINNGAETTRSAAVTLSLTADSPAGITAMQFSKDGSSWYPWEPFTTTRNATLSSGPSIKNVYVRFKDGAGNISPVYSDTISLVP